MTFNRLMLCLVVVGVVPPVPAFGAGLREAAVVIRDEAPIFEDSEGSDKTIKLPGEITLKPDEVVPMNPTRKGIATVPFTVKEIQPLIAEHVKMVNGVPHITGKNNKLVELAKYVAELNLWEQYLNTLGYTLRDRALALPRQPGQPGSIAIPGMRDNFGPILKLREPTKLDVPRPFEKPDVDVDKRTKPPFFDIEDPYAAVINPNVRIERGGVITSIPRIRSNARPGAAQYQVPRVNTLALRNMRTKRLPLPSLEAGPLLRTMDAKMPCSSTTAGGCPCSWEGPGCKDGVQVSQIDGGRILDCGVALNPVGGNSTQAPAPVSATTTTQGDSCGDKTSTDPSCLYDQNSGMHAKWTAIGNCVTSTSANTWFFVGVCSEMTFTGDQMGGNLFLNNSGQQHFSFKLFGKWFDLLDASSYSEYSKGQLSSSTQVSVPLLSEPDRPPKGFSGNYDMPPVTIPLAGIVNLKITGGGAFRMGFEKNDALFDKPPGICNLDAKNGMLGLNLESQAYADLHLTAALDALVLSAGIKGVLVLADDKVGLKMKDFIRPSSNEVVVSPNFTYHIQHMEGHVYVVLTVDVLSIYSKTFELELFNFGGFKTGEKVVVVPSRTFSTKVVGAK